VDGISVSESGILFGGMFLWKRSPVFAGVLIVAVVLFMVFLHMPFEKAERFARARRRRAECVGCGRKLPANSVGGLCGNCDSS
jgi:hypothetical protein